MAHLVLNDSTKIKVNKTCSIEGGKVIVDGKEIRNCKNLNNGCKCGQKCKRS